MSLEQSIKELNENIVKLNKTLEVYPSPIDNLVDSTQVDNALKAEDAENKSSPETSKPEHTVDELATLAREVIQADKSKGKDLKAKLTALGIGKVTLTPPEHVDDLHAFLEGLK